MTQMLKIAVQPGVHANVGVPLYPPVAARLNCETSVYAELAHISAAVTLVKDSGEIVEGQLGGSKLMDSAHPLPVSGHGSNGGSGHASSSGGGHASSSSSSSDKAYFYFPGLVIREPGRYKIRVTLLKLGENGYTSLEIVDTRAINVGHSNNLSHCTPSLGERAFLKILQADGKDVPSHP